MSLRHGVAHALGRHTVTPLSEPAHHHAISTTIRYPSSVIEHARSVLIAHLPSLTPPPSLPLHSLPQPVFVLSGGILLAIRRFVFKGATFRTTFGISLKGTLRNLTGAL